MIEEDLLTYDDKNQQVCKRDMLDKKIKKKRKFHDIVTNNL